MFFTTKMFLLIMILSMTVLNVLIAGEPTKIPWPIGYSESEMHYSRDLLRTYGNTNGIWGSSGNFHPGIDIPYNLKSRQIIPTQVLARRMLCRFPSAV